MSTVPFNIPEIQSNHITTIDYEIRNVMQGIVFDNEGCGIYAEFSWSSETALQSIKFNCVRGLNQVAAFAFDAEAKEFHLTLGDEETPSGTKFQCEHEIEKCNNSENGYTIIVDFNTEVEISIPERPGGVIIRPNP